MAEQNGSVVKLCDDALQKIDFGDGVYLDLNGKEARDLLNIIKFTHQQELKKLQGEIERIRIAIAPVLNAKTSDDAVATASNCVGAVADCVRLYGQYNCGNGIIEELKRLIGRLADALGDSTKYIRENEDWLPNERSPLDKAVFTRVTNTEALIQTARIIQLG